MRELGNEMKKNRWGKKRSTEETEECEKDQ